MARDDATGGPLLQATGIVKHYGGIHALKGVDFDVRAGEVHGLVGENGAGKSTLIKMLAGAETPDAGTVTLDGQHIPLGDTQASLAAGISTVYQEPHLFGELSVAENLFLGRELTRAGRVRWTQQATLATELLKRIGLDPALARRSVADLPVGQQQLISIAKAFAADAKILILDEPSAILADRDIETLFGVVRSLRAEGVGVIYISHRLDELGQITDRVTVMRDGEVVTTRPTVDLTTRQIAELMVGRALGHTENARPPVTGPVVLRVRDIAAGSALKNVSLDLHRGEVLGVYGLIGSGTWDLARALYGIAPTTHGDVAVGGVPVRLTSPAKAAAAGIVMSPGNRKAEGVFGDKSLAFNLSSSHLRHFSNAFGVMDARRERTRTTEFMQRLRIKAPTPTTRIGALSGGNQQKVVIARQLVEDAAVLVLEEPTQGVDVGAQEEIHHLIGDLAAQGSSCLVISTDLEEIRTLCDRVVVLHAGKVSAVFDRGVPTADLLAAASGADPDDDGGQVLTGAHAGSARDQEGAHR